MANTIKRKVLYHQLHVLDRANTTSANPVFYTQFTTSLLFEYISNLPTDEKKQKANSNGKFMALESFREIRTDVYFGVMRSNVSGSKKNLVDNRDNSERSNPKELFEGEKEITHFIFDESDKGNITLIIDYHMQGVSGRQLQKYLNIYKNKYIATNSMSNDFKYETVDVLRTNFMNQLNTLLRTTEFKIFMDSDVLDSRLGVLPQRLLNSVKQTVVIDSKADAKMDLKNSVQYIYNNMASSGVDKIWVRGTDSSNSPQTFYTDMMKKQSFITTNKTANGEIDTAQVMQNFVALI